LSVRLWPLKWQLVFKFLKIQKKIEHRM